MNKSPIFLMLALVILASSCRTSPSTHPTSAPVVLLPSDFVEKHRHFIEHPISMSEQRQLPSLVWKLNKDGSFHAYADTASSTYGIRGRWHVDSQNHLILSGQTYRTHAKATRPFNDKVTRVRVKAFAIPFGPKYTVVVLDRQLPLDYGSR